MGRSDRALPRLAATHHHYDDDDEQDHDDCSDADEHKNLPLVCAAGQTDLQPNAICFAITVRRTAGGDARGFACRQIDIGLAVAGSPF
jgi:hypothetical protein